MGATFDDLMQLKVAEERVSVAGVGVVVVRGMTGTQRDEFEVESERRRKAKPFALPVLFRARLLQACCFTEAGAPLIPKDKVAAVGDLPAGPLEPLVNAALHLSGLAAGDVEAAEKN